MERVAPVNGVGEAALDHLHVRLVCVGGLDAAQQDGRDVLFCGQKTESGGEDAAPVGLIACGTSVQQLDLPGGSVVDHLHIRALGKAAQEGGRAGDIGHLCRIIGQRALHAAEGRAGGVQVHGDLAVRALDAIRQRQRVGDLVQAALGVNAQPAGPAIHGRQMIGLGVGSLGIADIQVGVSVALAYDLEGQDDQLG